MAHRESNSEVEGVPTMRATRDEELWAFDRLPKGLRRALAAGEVNWSAVAIRAGMRKTKLKSRDVIAKLGEANRKVWRDTYGIELEEQGQ